MKKNINLNRLYLSCAIVFILSLIAAIIPVLQKFSNQIFYFGFPSRFLSIRASQSFDYSTSLDIGALAINILIVYGILHIIDKFRKSHKEEN